MSSSIRLPFPGIVLAIASLAAPTLSAQAENPRVQAGEAIVKVFKKEGEEITDVRRADPYRAPRYDAPTPTTPPAAVLDDANALLQRKQGAFFAEPSAKSSADAERLKLKLEKEQVSRQQMITPTREARTIADSSTAKPFGDAEFYARDYGGQAQDYSKLSSERATLRDGGSMETHWVENTKTGDRVAMKSIVEE
ncbi:hypothetical protein [Hyphomonas atlantica]|jgi:hypothetical protein|uniref:Uncharacterized protein n=1 Tax=Hyphomonas atlantica TaxID=1280948 RepID=A0A059E5V3_9PROT|nr:hypothetical protein [Hyphomonas atlantica]KCZ63023.1 hypothetical protein HY36_14925 [Hyphomonas atlantica]